jgi:hypothetical protein
MQVGTYTVVEVDPYGYSSITANSVLAIVNAGETCQVYFGDVLCLPDAPVLTFTAITGDLFTLDWNDVFATSYQLYSSSSPSGPFAPWGSPISGTTFSYADLRKQDGPYFYVVATNNCGQSLPSNVVFLKK